MSKLYIQSHGMLRKGKRMMIPPICHIENCKNIPEKDHFICEEHYQLMQFLKDDKWSRNYGCTMLLPQVGRVN